jgi:hypothetical protein
MENHKTICHLDSLKQSINSLEVKEVDLEAELHKFIIEYGPVADLEKCAKHFFKLGIQTSNPLTWKDIKLIWNITDEMDNMPEEMFYTEVLKRFKAQKGE